VYFECELLWSESWRLQGGALLHLSDAVLGSVMVFGLATGAVAVAENMFMDI
jgi:hypothetical protein